MRAGGGGDSAEPSRSASTTAVADPPAPKSIFSKKPLPATPSRQQASPQQAVTQQAVTQQPVTQQPVVSASGASDTAAPKAPSPFAGKRKLASPQPGRTALTPQPTGAQPNPTANPVSTPSTTPPTAVPTGTPPKSSAGLWVPTSKSDTYDDPGNKKTTKSKGGRAKAEAVKGTETREYNRTEKSNRERGRAVEAKARGKAQYEATAGDKDGLHATAKGKAKIGGNATAEGKAGGGLLHDIDGKTHGVYGELSAEAKARLEAAAKQEGKLAMGDFASFAASVEGKAWIEARAKAATSGSIGTDGVRADVEVHLGAEAGATITVTTELDVGDLGLDAEALAEFRAAAEIGGQGTFAVDAGGVTVGGEAYVFAGVEVKAEGEVRAKMYGRSVFAVKGNAGAHAGYRPGGGGFGTRCAVAGWWSASMLLRRPPCPPGRRSVLGSRSTPSQLRSHSLAVCRTLSGRGTATRARRRWPIPTRVRQSS